MNTINWRIRKVNNFEQLNEEDRLFFIEADLPDAEKNGHYPRVEVMQDDFGEHNGYTREIRLADAELIVTAPKMKDAITEVLEVLQGDGVPNNEWIKNRLLESLK